MPRVSWQAEEQSVVRLGVIVPSSNTAMEPLITSMLQDINNNAKFSKRFTVHFSRFRVTQIAIGESANAQFELNKMLEAAALLADARVDFIAWGGTSAGWLGFDHDWTLTDAVMERFGIPTSTSTIALWTYLRRPETQRAALVTPYTQVMNDAIVSNFGRQGIRLISPSNPLCITDNLEIGKTTQRQLTDMIEQVLSSDENIRYVMTYCTNMMSSAWAADWENRFKDRNIVVLDSVSILIWEILSSLNLQLRDAAVASKWGKLFGSHFLGSHFH